MEGSNQGRIYCPLWMDLFLSRTICKDSINPFIYYHISGSTSFTLLLLIWLHISNLAAWNLNEFNYYIWIGLSSSRKPRVNLEKITTTFSLDNYWIRPCKEMLSENSGRKIEDCNMWQGCMKKTCFSRSWSLISVKFRHRRNRDKRSSSSISNPVCSHLNCAVCCVYIYRLCLYVLVVISA